MGRHRSTGKRLTGGSVSVLGIGAGISTISTATEKDIIQALVTFLEDRRVLFNLERLEVESEADHSVLEIRRELTETLQQLDPNSQAARHVRGMRGACRRYLDKPRQQFRHIGGSRGRGINNPGFFVALGEFRATLGNEFKALSALFPLVIEPQLRDLFPVPD